MASIHLPIRQLVEFLLRTGSIDSRFAGFDRANEGARIHRKLQKAAGEGYQAEVFLSAEREACGIAFTLEGRADGIFTDENGTVTIDEIKTTTVPYEEITEELNPCHWAQGMVYAAIYSSQQGLETLAVRLTYYQVDTDQIQRFTRQFTRQQLEQFLQQLLTQYAPWAQRQLDWDTRRSQSLAALQFPFAEYRPGQRALAGEVYRACRAGKSADRKGGTRVFCQAPTGIGKTMSVLFPALKAALHKRRPVLKRVLVAAMTLVILTLGALAVSADFRKAVYTMIQKFLPIEMQLTYQVDGEPLEQLPNGYSDYYVPDGFERDREQEFERAENFLHVYSSKESGKGYTVRCSIIQPGQQSSFDNEHTTYENVKVGDADATLGTSASENGDTVYILSWERGGVSNTIMGNTSRDEIMRIAENVF